MKTQGELIRDYRIAGKVVDDLDWAQNPQLLAAYESDYAAAMAALE